MKQHENNTTTTKNKSSNHLGFDIIEISIVYLIIFFRLAWKLSQDNLPEEHYFLKKMYNIFCIGYEQMFIKLKYKIPQTEIIYY